jgi:hypothetical protein
MNSEHPFVIVVKARDYRLNEVQLENLAAEFEGYPVQLTGGCDDIHMEFRAKAHADGFKNALKPFKI